MLKLSLSLALMLSAAGTFASAGPLLATMPNAPVGSLVTQVGCNGDIDAPLKNGSRQVRRKGNCASDSVGSQSDNRRIVNQRNFDCHRDVRTHRVGGIRLKHRHVGNNCAIREVRTSN